MLALLLACRVLLLVLLAASSQTADKSQLLISEGVWSRGCALDCQRGRHRAVCGSNGRLYKSLCAFQRAQCLNTQLRSVPHTHCIEPAQSKCQLARSQALESSSHSDTPAVFVPECTADGSFLQVQCHSQTGYCWCSTPDGKPVSGTSSLHHKPNCTGQFSDAQLLPNAEPAQREEGSSRLRPTGDPAGTLPLHPAEITAPPFWVTILLNSDPKGNRSVKQPTDTPLICERERAALLLEQRPQWQEERFVPECSADGGYRAVQCHGATGYCWCVREDTGRPLPGTSTRNQLPDCSAEEPGDRSYRDRPLAGCPGSRKKAFVQSVVRLLLLESGQDGGELSPHRMEDLPRSVLGSPPPAAPSPAPSGGWDVSGAEGALRGLFLQLDGDGSGVLSDREARPLRLFLRRKLRPRRCARKFSQHCDRNRDRGLTLAELTACLGLRGETWREGAEEEREISLSV
ncbi:hypothetical protein AAFF_G00037370 [Aldrovandia affinis]|uniref:SPARC-related modular calcium-binding protein 1 n=1 Tax=Aldrovandia affinis TaxID=143900 RepID=A0AAD7T5B3_9TELE|nr:hypothetical protein AAFF_G00037370 [Aldrovandia affinis]